MAIHQIIYISQFYEKPTEAQLSELLHHARSKNHQLLITGILLYAEGRILQVLEGQEAAVRAVFNTITHDKRHHQLVKLVDAAVPQRRFPDWSMGFTVAQPTEYEYVTGYVNPGKPLFPLPRAHNASPALMQLLLNFVALHPVLA
jgi:hypothetical protein